MLSTCHIKGLLVGLVLPGVLYGSAQADYGWGDSSVLALDLSTTWYDSSGSGDSNTFALDLSITWYDSTGSGDSNTFEIACGVYADCDDLDVCTYDECVAEACTHTPRLYGDINGNGFPSVFDIFCILDLIAGNPVVPECDAVNADISGGQGECGANGVLNVFDMFAVLDVIAGVDPCCSPQLTGACCNEGVCTDGVTHANCHYGSGIYMGDGTDCGSVTCP